MSQHRLCGTGDCLRCPSCVDLEYVALLFVGKKAQSGHLALMAKDESKIHTVWLKCHSRTPVAIPSPEGHPCTDRQARPGNPPVLIQLFTSASSVPLDCCQVLSPPPMVSTTEASGLLVWGQSQPGPPFTMVHECNGPDPQVSITRRSASGRGAGMLTPLPWAVDMP